MSIGLAVDAEDSEPESLMAEGDNGRCVKGDEVKEGAVQGDGVKRHSVSPASLPNCGMTYTALYGVVWLSTPQWPAYRLYAHVVYLRDSVVLVRSLYWLHSRSTARIRLVVHEM